MKAWKVLLLIALVIQFSCDKNDSDEINLDVETYIRLLKSSEYVSSQLPAFTYKDIPALLQYRSENEIITHFPHNPISSLYGPECQLGIYVLWTIESIRAVSIQSERVIMRFPSQNPILAHRDSARLYLISDDTSHEVAAKAYYDWWKKNKNKDFDDFKNTDPLEKTDYRWH